MFQNCNGFFNRRFHEDQESNQGFSSRSFTGVAAQSEELAVTSGGPT